MSPQLPCRLCADVADCLVGSPTLQAAYDALTARFVESLPSECCIFVQKVSGWTRVAGRVDGERERRWRRSLEQLSGDRPVVFRIGAENEPPATAIWIADVEPAVVVVEGDWTESQDVLTACASVMRSELRSIRTQQVSRRAHQLLTGGHRLVRELTTTRDPAVLMARIVDRVAEMFSAERVSLAVYDKEKEEKTLQIAATHGFPLSLVQDVRIKPGEWVIGRVSTTRKVLRGAGCPTAAWQPCPPQSLSQSFVCRRPGVLRHARRSGSLDHRTARRRRVRDHRPDCAARDWCARRRGHRRRRYLPPTWRGSNARRRSTR